MQDFVIGVVTVVVCLAGVVGLVLAFCIYMYLNLQEGDTYEDAEGGKAHVYF